MSTITGNNIIAAVSGGTLALTTLVGKDGGATGSDVLLRTPATIVGEYIIAVLALMTRPSAGDAWPLYISHLPDNDNVETDAGAIYDTSGNKDGRLMIGPVIQHFGIQIRFRSRDYNTGFEKIEDVAASLDAILRATVIMDTEQYRIQNMTRTTPIISLGLEPESTKRRFLFTVNFIASIKEIS